MNSRYASGKYGFEIRMKEEVPEGRQEVPSYLSLGTKYSLLQSPGGTTQQ